jgi:hypothetical protein
MVRYQLSSRPVDGIRVIFRDMPGWEDLPVTPSLLGGPLREGGAPLAGVASVFESLTTFCQLVNFATVLENQSQLSPEERQFYVETLQLAYTASPGKISAIDYQRIVGVHSSLTPAVRRVSMGSPLTIELIGSGLTGALFLLKHPESIGGWLPRVRESWFNARAAADRARENYQTLKNAGIEVEDLER